MGSISLEIKEAFPLVGCLAFSASISARLAAAASMEFGFLGAASFAETCSISFEPKDALPTLLP
jgi:hypothetical protein